MLVLYVLVSEQPLSFAGEVVLIQSPLVFGFRSFPYVPANAVGSEPVFSNRGSVAIPLDSQFFMDEVL